MADSNCEKHGAKEFIKGAAGIFPDMYICATCSEESEEKRMILEKKEEEEHNREIQRQKVKRLFKECEIGQRFVSVSFDDYRPTADKAGTVKNKCAAYAQAFNLHMKDGGGLVMVGKAGTGKNHLAAAICNHVMHDGYSTLHTTVMKMIRRVKATWSRDSEETEQKAILSFCSPDLLVIDEVGIQFGSSTEQLLLTEIINERYERMRPTIMISNMPASELSDLLGERVIDRFRDGGEVLVFDWESYRKK